MKVTTNSEVNVYAGIDVHLKQWNVAIYVEDRFFKVFQQEPNSRLLINYLRKNFPNAKYHSVYEAGYFGYSAHRELCSGGVNNIVINPADVPTNDKERRRKSDKIDAKKLAKNLVRGELVGIYVPTEEEQAARDLVRYRITKSRKALTRIKQQIKAFLMSRGIDYNKMTQSSDWSSKYIEAIEAIEFKYPSDHFIRLKLLTKYQYIKSEQRDINRKIVQLSTEDRYGDLVRRIRTIPGVGLLTAMTLITQIIDMKRFKSIDHLCSYIGIIPDTQSSAEKTSVKGLTFRTNKDVRRVLLQAAWSSAGKAPDIAVSYQKWKKDNGNLGSKAIVKVARKLLSIIRSLWLYDQVYSPQT